MSIRLIQRWSYVRFDERMGGHRFALLAVDRGRPRLDPGLVAWFDKNWPGEFAFGTLDTSRPAPAGFWQKMFRTSGGSLRMGPSGPLAGVYLFQWGVVVGFHTGVVSTGPIADDLADFVRPKVRIGVPDTVVAMTRYLSEIVARKLGGSDGWTGDVSESNKATDPGAPPRSKAGHRTQGRERTVSKPPAPKANVDYELLGVAAGASLRDVSAAYRNQVKLNHPDKVAHLSPALQKFAEQQTVALTQAYERIKKAMS